jgi:hypothetical protein
MTHYDTHQLRQFAAKNLKLEDVPDEVWNKGITRQFVQLWDSADTADKRVEVQDKLLNLLREDIRSVVRLGVDMTPWTTKQRQKRASIEADLSPDNAIAVRAEALCTYWAKLAEADRNVRMFRERVLGGTVISADEARRMITSPATSILRPENFAKCGAPIVGHTAELGVAERSNPFERPYVLRGSLRLTWATGEAVIPVKYEGGLPPESVELWDGTEPIIVAPWSLSVLGQLHKTATKLAERYPWETPAAAWLMLTGEPPWVPPLAATSSGPDLAKNHGTITIRAAYWVPEEAVRNIYLEMKARMKPSPTPSARRLALFRFVAERSSGVNEFDRGALVTGLNSPTWRTLRSEWNKEYPPGHKWHYSDFRNLRRDFKEASKLLIGY